MCAIGQLKMLRLVAGLGGVGLFVYGLLGLRAGVGRGAAAAMVLAVVIVYWAWAGRAPGWWRR